MTHDQILECLHRQFSNPVTDPDHSCGSGCTLFMDAGAGCCGLAGTPEQYSFYQSLLRDPSIPADQAQPLIDALEKGKSVFIEYDEFAPDHTQLLKDVYRLVTERK